MDNKKIVIFSNSGVKEVYLIDPRENIIAPFGIEMLPSTVLYHSGEIVKPGSTYLLPTARIEKEGVIL